MSEEVVFGRCWVLLEIGQDDDEMHHLDFHGVFSSRETARDYIFDDIGLSPDQLVRLTYRDSDETYRETKEGGKLIICRATVNEGVSWGWALEDESSGTPATVK